jgi:hypothetical protein
MVSKLPVLGVLLPHKPKPPLRFFFTIPIVFLLKLSSLQSSVFGQFHYVILVQSVSEFFVLLLSTTLFQQDLHFPSRIDSHRPYYLNRNRKQNQDPENLRRRSNDALSHAHFILQRFPARAPHVAVPCRTFPESSSKPPCSIWGPKIAI